MNYDGLAYERPKITKWFPKGNRFLFKLSTPEKLDDPVQTGINLYPVEIFKGKAAPSTFPCSLYWEEDEEEDPIIVV